MRKYVGPAKDSHNFEEELGGEIQRQNKQALLTRATRAVRARWNGGMRWWWCWWWWTRSKTLACNAHKFDGDAGRTEIVQQVLR